MPKIIKDIIIQKLGSTAKSPEAIKDDILRQHAFDSGAQANIISNVSNGKIEMANSAAGKLLGYSKKELLSKARSDLFAVNERYFKMLLTQRKEDGKSVALVTLIKKNAVLIPCEITSSVFKMVDGSEKAISTISDRSKNIRTKKNVDAKEDKETAGNIEIDKSEHNGIDNKKEIVATGDITLAEEVNKEWKKNIGKTSYDVMWDWDINSGEIYVGDSIKEVFGYSVQNNTITFADFTSKLLEAEKDAIEKKIKDTLASHKNNWNAEFKLKCRDGSEAFTRSRANILRDSQGNALHMIGATKDVSNIKQLKDEMKEKLEVEIKIKERQIEEATEDAIDMERTFLRDELHDNINQLLAASKMYLEMAKKGDINREIYLGRSSQYTMEAINAIRKLTSGLNGNSIKGDGLYDSITKLMADTMETCPVKITCRMEGFKEKEVNDKFKLNVFRIVQEQLTNILIHANADRISIDLSQNNEFIGLVISDDGIGFDSSKKHTGIGLSNIKSRAASYKGIAKIDTKPGNGCALTVSFPTGEVLLKKTGT